MIQELILLNRGGLALFYHNFLEKNKKQVNYQLTGSFLYHIYDFTKFCLKYNLVLISMTKCFFYFYAHKKSDLRLICKCDKSKYDKTKVIKKSLDLFAKNLIDIFLIAFKNDLENFDGEISRFYSFTKIIDDIFNSEHYK
ncbi:MAG: hypothetical protein ACFFAN_11235 [Promethearchaeota archaeon]